MLNELQSAPPKLQNDNSLSTLLISGLIVRIDGLLLDCLRWGPANAPGGML